MILLREFCMWHIVIVDGPLQVIKQYVAITAYGFTLSAEAVGWTPNSFSFFLPSLLLLHSPRLQVVFTPLLCFSSSPSNSLKESLSGILTLPSFYLGISKMETLKLCLKLFTKAAVWSDILQICISSFLLNNVCLLNSCRKMEYLTLAVVFTKKLYLFQNIEATKCACFWYDYIWLISWRESAIPRWLSDHQDTQN